MTLIHCTGIKLSDHTSNHYRVETWYNESNKHYLANHSKGRFFINIYSKNLKRAQKFFLILKHPLYKLNFDH